MGKSLVSCFLTDSVVLSDYIKILYDTDILVAFLIFAWLVIYPLLSATA